jgi:hypothetical protein
MLKMSNAKENKELAPELKASQQHHLSHSLKCQPSHKMKRLMSCMRHNVIIKLPNIKAVQSSFSKDGLVQRN